MNVEVDFSLSFKARCYFAAVKFLLWCGVPIDTTKAAERCMRGATILVNGKQIVLGAK